MFIVHCKYSDLFILFYDLNRRTRAVQKVIETLKSPAQFSLVVSSLKPGIVALIKNMNGNHVAQRCLLYLMPEYSKVKYHPPYLLHHILKAYTCDLSSKEVISRILFHVCFCS